MTGQDIQMRSDAQTAQVEAQYAQIGAGFQQQQIDTIRNMPGQLQEMQMRQQMMEQQQMESMLLERKAESDLRMQEVAMQQQLQKGKMADLLFADEVARSRLNVEATALAVRERKMDIDQKAHALKNRDKSASFDANMAMLKALKGPAFARMKGKKFTVEDGRFLFEEPKSPEDLEEFAQSIAEVDVGDAIAERRENRLASQQVADNAYRSQDIALRAQRAQDAAGQSRRAEALKKAELIAEITKVDQITGQPVHSEKAREAIAKQAGIEIPKDLVPKKPSPKQAKATERIGSIESRLTEDAFGPDWKGSMAKAIETSRPALKAAFERNWNPSRPKMSNDEFDEFLVGILNNTKDPRFDDLVQRLRFSLRGGQ